MRFAFLAVVAASILGLAASAFAGSPGITIDQNVRFEFTDCASGGSAAQTLTLNRKYLMRITDADTFVCFAASGSTCASGGEKFPLGTVLPLFIGTDYKSVSCRSADSTGDVIFTKVD
jgi:hypothetical protein